MACTCQISTELQITEVSVASIDFTTDVLQAVLEILKQTKETLAVESVFGIAIGGWIGQLRLF